MTTTNSQRVRLTGLFAIMAFHLGGAPAATQPICIGWAAGQQDLYRVDRNGAIEATYPLPAQLRDPRVSIDGLKLASIDDAPTPQISIFDGALRTFAADATYNDD